MTVEQTDIEGILVFKPNVYGDARGHFFESFREDVMKDHGVNEAFVQDNQSLSNKGILRGLHFQKNPYAQGKLVRVIKGAVRDVVVDIRKDSATYGKHFSIDLNEENKTMMYVPPGFAHGFLTLEDQTIFAYKCTNYYYPDSEGAVLWNSPSLGIQWDVEDPLLSEKDKIATDFSVFISPF